MSEQPQNKVDLRITPEFAAQAGKGRPKGVPNKATKALKDMILEALDRKGGADYLERQADENPTAFLTLVGKVLPLQLTGENGGAIKVQEVRRTFHRSEPMSSTTANAALAVLDESLREPE